MTQDSNPYSQVTQLNESGDWLTLKPVDTDLGSMLDYAKTVNTIAGSLSDRQSRLVQQIIAIAQDAFLGGFPEIGYAGTLHGQNLSELSQYLQQLWAGIYHTASAAKVIADAYHDSDSFSAISVNDVMFAFGATDVPRPSGLPSLVGTTFSAAEEKQQAAGKLDQSRPAPIWTPDVQQTVDANTTLLTYHDQYGETRTITVTTNPDGSQTTTIVDPGGTTKTTSTPFAWDSVSGTSTTTVSPDGSTTTSSQYSYGTATGYVTAQEQGGKLTSQTAVTVNAGSQTTQVYSVDNGKQTLAEQYAIGDDAPADTSGTIDSPSNDAIQKLQDDMGGEILAPGPTPDPQPGPSPTPTV